MYDVRYFAHDAIARHLRSQCVALIQSSGVSCCMPVTGGLRCNLLQCILSMQVSSGEKGGGTLGERVREGGKGGG